LVGRTAGSIPPRRTDSRPWADSDLREGANWIVSGFLFHCWRHR